MTLTTLLKELKDNVRCDAHLASYNPEYKKYVEIIGSQDILFLIQAIEEMKEVLSEYADGQDYSGYAKEVL